MPTSHDPHPADPGRSSRRRARAGKYGLRRWLLVPLALISSTYVPGVAAAVTQTSHSSGPVVALGGEAGFATQRNTFPLQPEPPVPRSCSIGFYVDDLYNFSPTTNSFEARIWVWSVCPDSSLNPLDTLEFTNANTTTTNQESSTIEPNGVQYSNMQVSGKFRHEFNLRRYPFDRQLLQIVVENGNDPVEFEIYTADNVESRCAPDIGQDGLAVRGCSVKAGTHQYATSFGAPGEENSNGSGYSKVTVEIEMTRNSTLALFLKSTFVYFVAFLMAPFSLVMFKKDEWTTPRRFGVIGLGLFATALWMSNQTALLNSSSQFTLLDALGILTLVAIICAASIAAWDGVRLERGKEYTSVRAAGYRSALILTIGYIILSVVLTTIAAS